MAQLSLDYFKEMNKLHSKPHYRLHLIQSCLTSLAFACNYQFRFSIRIARFQFFINNSFANLKYEIRNLNEIGKRVYSFKQL
jgi:hypothetical protein